MLGNGKFPVSAYMPATVVGGDNGEANVSFSSDPAPWGRHQWPFAFERTVVVFQTWAKPSLFPWIQRIQVSKRARRQFNVAVALSVLTFSCDIEMIKGN